MTDVNPKLNLFSALQVSESLVIPYTTKTFVIDANMLTDWFRLLSRLSMFKFLGNLCGSDISHSLPSSGHTNTAGSSYVNSTRQNTKTPY